MGRNGMADGEGMGWKEGLVTESGFIIIYIYVCMWGVSGEGNVAM